MAFRDRLSQRRLEHTEMLSTEDNELLERSIRIKFLHISNPDICVRWISLIHTRCGTSHLVPCHAPGNQSNNQTNDAFMHQRRSIIFFQEQIRTDVSPLETHLRRVACSASWVSQYPGMSIAVIFILCISYTA